MGSASSINVSATSEDLQEFLGYFTPLTGTDTASRKLRNLAWLGADPNNNGLTSLAEIDGWIKKTIAGDASNIGGQEKALLLWKRFRPSYIRAFNDAKDIGKDKAINSTGDATTEDYVTRGEFRLLNAYIAIYAVMYDAFTKIDGGGEGVTKDDDRRISLEEFKAGYDTVSKYPLVALQEQGNPEEIFKAMDADGKGKVLLNEFCKYCENAEQKAATEIGKLLAVGDADELRVIKKAELEKFQ